MTAKPPEPKSVEDIFSMFGDLFSGFFSGMRPGRAAVDMRITDEEAAVGVTREVKVQRWTPCAKCKGHDQLSSADKGRRAACRLCNGTGNRTQTQGFFLIQATCDGCAPKQSSACSACNGSLGTHVSGTASVTIPAGVTHGHVLVVPDPAAVKEDGTPGEIGVHILVGDLPDPRLAAFGEPPPAELPRAAIHRPATPNPLLDVKVIAGGIALAVFLALLFLR